MFEKILIANRGEIACRVIRTCKKLGIKTVAVYSDADANAQHVLQADEAWHIGGSRPQESYLQADAVLEAARKSGAQAIHPGYGFLSENADFADAVEAAGLVFIGPRAASMRKMGSKAGAKELMDPAGVPVVPGYTGENQSPDLLQQEADRIGYPLMIKAAHGGGGKGMRIVRASGEFAANLKSCQREAKNAFGRDRVLLERYIETPRHIEIQIFGDAAGRVIHLNERECSAQRRYQKVLEEAPSPFLTPEMREAMGRAAVLAGEAIEYQNAGTVEFIVAADGSFYFMEINTRLQVEHPVTELVTGFDLVEWQLRVASGEDLPASQDEILQYGHAIEVRLYAEDPDAGFLPGSGTLKHLRLPAPSRNVRIDSGVVEGDTVSIFYDPMIAKLIVWDVTRERALMRMQEALAECEIEGPKSNIAFLERLVRHPAVREGRIDTGYLDAHLDEFVGVSENDDHAELDAVAAAIHAHVEDTAGTSPWHRNDAWRIDGAASQPVRIAQGNAGRIFHVTRRPGAVTVQVDDTQHTFDTLDIGPGTVTLARNGRTQNLAYRKRGTVLTLFANDKRHVYEQHPLHELADAAAGGTGNALVAPMPGRVVVVNAAVGDAVNEGDVLMVMEAMKMELSLKAARAGTVAEVRAESGAFVEADTVLIVLETEA